MNKISQDSKRLNIQGLSLIKANGPAIKGGCVTRRPSGQVMLFFSRSIVTVGTEGMARVFAVQVQSVLSYMSVAVQG